METNLITVTFKVPDDLKAQINSMKTGLFPDLAKSENEMFAPHITIYQCKVPEAEAGNALGVLADIANEMYPVLFQANGVNIKNEYVGIAYNKSEAVMDVHKRVVEELNSLRGGLIRSTYVDKKDSYNSAEQAYIDKYGYPYVLDEYNPHLTLVRLENKSDIEKINNSEVPMMDFTSPGFEVVVINGKGKEVKFVSFRK